MIKSPLTDILKIEYPIFQGGMAWISESNLAAAVSNAGGLGVIAAGAAPGEWVRSEIRKAKALTDKPFGVNIMLLSEFAEDIAKVVCEEGVKVVITGAGNPGKYVQKWKENGIIVIPVVPSVALAKRMERTGVDAVVAEGHESGGHIGEITTMALVPQVVDALKIPVIAAGGIADGRGIAAAFMLGAVGVQVGTRFLVANECKVHNNYKKTILEANDTETTVTGRSTGHPVRVIKNKLARQFIQLEKGAVAPDQLEELGRGKLRLSAVEGDVEGGSVMSGQIAGLVKKEQSCKEIIQEMFSEAKQDIERVTKLVY